MIKSELVDVVAHRNPHLYRSDVERIVNVMFDTIAEALANGSRVELRGFGVFSIRHRLPRAGRNPRTGAAVYVEEQWSPFFRAGKPLLKRLNRSGRR